MADIKIAYGTNEVVTVTGLASLADGSSATSDAVDNSSNLYVDALCDVDLDGFSGSQTGPVNVYLQGSIDGTNFDTAGADTLVAVIPMNNTDPVSKSFTVASAMGGVLPRHWKLRFENDSGAALNSTGNSLAYRGVYYTGT
jgi:hypothetical protein